MPFVEKSLLSLLWSPSQLVQIPSPFSLSQEFDENKQILWGVNAKLMCPVLRREWGHVSTFHFFDRKEETLPLALLIACRISARSKSL